MATVVESIVIRAPCERVFAYRLDVTTLPEYNPDVRELEALTGGPPGPGSRYRFRVRLSRWLTLPTTLTVREADPPKRLVFEIASIMDARETCTFEPLDGSTRVRFETDVRTPGRRIAPLVDRLFVVPNARRQIQAELARMKERLEAPSS